MEKVSLMTAKSGLIAMGALIAMVPVGGALSMVWTKQQIYRSAENRVSIEKAIMEAERKNIHLRSRIAQLHNPEYLKAKIKDGLIQPKVKQIVWMSGSRVEDILVASNVNQPIAMANATTNPSRPH